MDLSPVRSYPEPAYPTRCVLLADPGILQRHIPPSWRRLAGVGGILAFFLHAEVLAGETPPPAAPGDAAVTVAPIFRHGAGRGSFGCMAVAPPVFLSEEEALAVIGEELGRKGVVLSDRAAVWSDTRVAPRIRERVLPAGVAIANADNQGEVRLVEQPEHARPLALDAIDPGKGIAVEYLSHDDYDPLGGVHPSSERLVHADQAGEADLRSGWRSSSVRSYDFVEAASHLASTAAVHHEPGRRWLGVFYDPMARAGDFRGPPMPEGLDAAAKQTWRQQRWEDRTAAAKAVAVDELRLQVRDFIAWLEAQGAL